MPRPVGALKQIIQPPRSHRDIGGSSPPNSGEASGGGTTVRHRGIIRADPDSIPEDEAQRRAKQIAEDFCRLVATSKTRVAAEQSAKDDEAGNGIEAFSQTEPDLLASLASNWQFLRTTAQKAKPKIDFLLLATWFSKRGDHTDRFSDDEEDEDEMSLSAALTETEKEISLTDALKELKLDTKSLIPSSDPLTLFEQIIDLYNQHVQAWNDECAEINHVYLSNPYDESAPTTRNLMYFQDYRRSTRPFDKTHPQFPPGDHLLTNIRFRTEIIDTLHEEYTQWQERQDKYQAEWNKQLEEKGPVKLWQEINESVEKEWAKYQESENRRAADRLESKRFWYKYGAGVTRLLRVKFRGYPEELMTEEERGRMWKNKLRGMVKRDDKKKKKIRLGSR